MFISQDIPVFLQWWRLPVGVCCAVLVKVLWEVVLAAGARCCSNDGVRGTTSGRRSRSGLHDGGSSGDAAASLRHWTAKGRPPASHAVRLGCRRRIGGWRWIEFHRSAASTSRRGWRRRGRRCYRRRYWPRWVGTRQNRTLARLLNKTSSTSPRRSLDQTQAYRSTSVTEAVLSLLLVLFNHCFMRVCIKLTLWRPLLPYGTAIKHPVPDRVKPPFVIWHPGTLTPSTERQSARMSKIANDGLTRPGTGCFIQLYPYDNRGHQRVKICLYPGQMRTFSRPY